MFATAMFITGAMTLIEISALVEFETKSL